MGKIAFGIFLVLVMFGTCAGVGSYNSLVHKREVVTSQWSQVENVYQRRYDLIPNLVETVRGYAKHEHSIFVEVAEARAKVNHIKVDADKITSEQGFGEYLKQFGQAQGELSSALSRLMVVVENYPVLKADALFSNLMNQLEGSENRISVERKRYNDVAKEYNAVIQTFPTNMIAGAFHFEKKPYFEAEEGSEKAPKVTFE